jgi:hypothetical protein
MSRESLVQAYIAALPLSPIAVVALPGGGCRVAVGGEVAPGETVIQQFYFRRTHVELSRVPLQIRRRAPWLR